MKNWEKILDALWKTWEETCPSKYKWHYTKNGINCTFDWITKTFIFYKQ